MRITLEATDILALLSKHFGRDISPEQVDFRLEPLEIEVSGVDPVPAAASVPPVSLHAKPNVRGYSEQTIEDDGESMEETLKKAREIESIARRGSYVR